MKNACFEKLEPELAKIMGYEWAYSVCGGTLHFARTFEDMINECNELGWKLTQCINQPLEVILGEK